MAAGLQVPRFDDAGSDVESYLERLDCYFDLAKTEADQKATLLLCGLSAKQYQTLRDLVAPAVPKSRSFDELKETLISHYGSAKRSHGTCHFLACYAERERVDS